MFNTRDDDKYLQLLAFAERPGSVWQAEELPAIWCHQMSCRFVSLMQEIDCLLALEAQSICDAEQPPIDTLHDLLLRASPPSRLLHMLSDWIQRTLGDPKELIPRDVAVAMLNVTDIVARVSHGSSLINIPDHELALRATWIAEQVWIDAATRARIHDAVGVLGVPDQST